MKKLVVLSIVAAMAVTGCKKEEVKDGSLVGQKWERTDRYDPDLSRHRSSYGGDWAHVIEFMSADKLAMYYVKDNHIYFVDGEFNYEYKEPDVIVDIDTNNHFILSSGKEVKYTDVRYRILSSKTMVTENAKYMLYGIENQYTYHPIYK